MRFSSPVRTDLVISMTLAETFLLLLFVVWYGYTTIPDSRRMVAVIEERLARIEKENERLARELKQANGRIADLESLLKQWEALTGFDNPPSPDVFGDWIKEACRSHPKCEQNNVLVHASVVRGQVSMVWLTESPKLSESLAKSGRPHPTVGVRITDMKMIQAFLDGVRDYYSSNPTKDGTECRFDYRLTYESKEDYYDGRELFEHYFYPAAIKLSHPDAR
jgi:hypothetical protein